MDATGATPKKWHSVFLKKLTSSPNVAAACRTARIDRSTAYRERADYPDFATAWEEARQMGLDALEDKAFQRAEKESDTLMIFLLKAHRPAVYNVPQRLSHGGDPDAPPIELHAKATFDHAAFAEEFNALLGLPTGDEGREE